MGPSLLDLSRELRDLIWESCLTTPERPPPPPSGSPCNNPEWDDRYFFCINEEEQFIGWPKRTLQISSIPLLLTNRQINTEIHETIARLYSQRRMDCNLQVTIYREKYLLLDWLCLPVNALHYDNWNIDFRQIDPPLWGIDDRTREPDQSILEVFHPDRYPRVIWSYFYIHQRFLERGPGFRSYPEFHITQAPPRTRSLRRLVLNCEIPEISPNDEFRDVEHRNRPIRKPTTLREWQKFYAGGLLDPRQFTRQLRFLVQEWLFSNKLQAQARPAFESHPKIEMRANGRLIPGAEWDLRTLTGTAYKSPPGQRCAVFERNIKMPIDKIYGSLVDPEMVKEREEKDREKRKEWESRKRKQESFLGRRASKTDDVGGNGRDTRATRRRKVGTT